MNSSLLRVLAVFLAIGAISIGYLGYRAGNDQKTVAPAPVKVEPAGETVILAAREIPAGKAITAEDLTQGRVPARPPKAYVSDQTLIGKKPKQTIANGEMLLSGHFPNHSELSKTLKPGERALAVKVDEVVGTGGFIEPGDRVDVLLFLHADKNEIGEHSSAQVVLTNLRVLAFGNMLEAPIEKGAGHAEPASGLIAKAQNTSKDVAGKDKKEAPTAKKSRTAVLAVSAEDTTKLMLAESSGKIRLALHGPDESNPARPTSAESPPGFASPPSNLRITEQRRIETRNNFIELRDLVGKRSAVKVRTRGVESGSKAIVHKGSVTETVVLGRSGGVFSLSQSGTSNLLNVGIQQ